MTRERWRIRITGQVQGVGFRPHVYAQALAVGATGHVGNDGAGVFIEAEGLPAELSDFVRRIREFAPPHARIESLEVHAIQTLGDSSFVIVNSAAVAVGQPHIPPDLAVCSDCLCELFDPANRRYRYPFTVCTHCGPRFTLVERFPYDRASTTMGKFEMCPDCEREYLDPANRRFHAQPIACPACGPAYQLVDGTGVAVPSSGDAIDAARQLLMQGKVVAIKGVGGFHLACDAGNPGAINMLRMRKRRAHKPLAVMVASVALAESMVRLSDVERALLAMPERPIVLLRKLSPHERDLAPDNACLGIMLPYAPVHHLLFEGDAFACGLVMTSGNLNEEPICVSNSDALARLGSIADAFLIHNRDIVTACDDSVMAVWNGTPQFARRSRGYAPAALPLPHPVQPTLAGGGDIKNVFCFADGTEARPSQHLGDLANLQTQQAAAHTKALFATAHAATGFAHVCDLHPGYHSTRALAMHRPVRVQHHHAHAAALMAEHGLKEGQRIIAMVMDGTGYGTDGAIWGCEALIAGYDSFARAGRLHYWPLPGGDAAVERPYRNALAHLWLHQLPWDGDLPCVNAASEAELVLLHAQLERNINCTPCGSLGRLFDAVAALLGFCLHSTHEAQAAFALEAAALSATPDDATYPIVFAGGQVMLGDFWRALLNDWTHHVPAGTIALRFHNTVRAMIIEMAQAARQISGLDIVGLTGGCFHNQLLAPVVQQLEAEGFSVLTHTRVPPGDGGLALGQIAVGAQRA